MCVWVWCGGEVDVVYINNIPIMYSKYKIL